MKRMFNMKTALVISLAFNVLFVTMVAGAIMKGAGRPERAPEEMWMFFRALPQDVRRDMAQARREMQPNRGNAEASLRQMHMKDLAVAIEAEPMDKDEFVQIMRMGREARDMQAVATEEMIAEKLSELPLEKRQELAEKLRNAGAGDKKGKRKERD